MSDTSNTSEAADHDPTERPIENKQRSHESDEIRESNKAAERGDG